MFQLMSSEARGRRRAAIDRYLEALDEFDAFTQQREADKAAGIPVPRTEEEDLEYQRLNTALHEAAMAAPGWARLWWQ